MRRWAMCAAASVTMGQPPMARAKHPQNADCCEGFPDTTTDGHGGERDQTENATPQAIRRQAHGRGHAGGHGDHAPVEARQRPSCAQ